MTTRTISCGDCHVVMQPIKLIDATQPGFDTKGIRHVELAYSTPDAKASPWLGRIPQLGTVKGMICPECGRIQLYGEPRAT